MLISWFDDAWRNKTEQIVYLLDTFHGKEREKRNGGGENDENV